MPTPGRIPVWKPGPGVFTFSGQAFTVEGPLARTVDDLALAYSVMCGPDGIDTLTVPAVDDPYPGAPRRAAVVTDPGGKGTAPSVTAAVRRAADALRAAGWEVSEAEPPFIAEANAPAASSPPSIPGNRLGGWLLRTTAQTYTAFG